VAREAEVDVSVIHAEEGQSLHTAEGVEGESLGGDGLEVSQDLTTTTTTTTMKHQVDAHLASSTPYDHADGVIILYDVTSEASFAAVPGILTELGKNAPEGMTVMLVGNKADRPSERPRRVSVADAAAFAEKHRLPFLEVSAKRGIGVDQAFGALLWHCKLRWHDFRLQMVPKGDPNQVRLRVVERAPLPP